jgi:hypothetical protein
MAAFAPFHLQVACQVVPAFFRRVPPKSDIAISSWKVHCWLVRAVHEDDGSRVTVRGTRVVPGDRKPSRFCLECRSRACANPRVLACRFFRLLSRCYPLSYCSPLLRLYCVNEPGSSQRTIYVPSLHPQMVNVEDARSMPHPVGKPSLWRASGYSRYPADTRDGRTMADRARGQSLPPIATRKRACRFEGLIPV